MLQAILSYVPVQYVPYVTAAITICAAIAVILPPPGTSGIIASPAYAGVYKAVQWIALNKGQAANANDVKKP